MSAARVSSNTMLTARSIDNSETVCDLNYDASQWIDRLLVDNSGRESASHPRDQFLRLMQSGQFDLMLTFGAGGLDVIHPGGGGGTDNNIASSVRRTFASFATSIAEHKPEHGHWASHCPPNAMRTSNEQKLQRFANQLYERHALPMFALRAWCCSLPTDAQLATVWRRNIHQVLNFLRLLETGVEGRVVAAGGEGATALLPLRAARVLLDGRELSVSPNRAHFKVVLPAGEHELIVRAAGYADVRRVVQVQRGGVLDVGEVRLVAGVSGGLSVQPVGGGGSVGNVGAGNGLVSGFVLDATNHPIAGATVRLLDANGVAWTNVSDAQGAFVLLGTRSGNGTLTVTANGHVDTERWVSIFIL